MILIEITADYNYHAQKWFVLAIYRLSSVQIRALLFRVWRKLVSINFVGVLDFLPRDSHDSIVWMLFLW